MMVPSYVCNSASRGQPSGTVSMLALSVINDVVQLQSLGFSDQKSVDAPFDRGSRVDDSSDGSRRGGVILDKLHGLSSKFELCKLEIRSRDATTGVEALP
jgi:hypothetical protein